MTIAKTYFWIDRSSREIGIRSANRANDTQPFECWLKKYPRWMDFNFYEDTGDGAVEIRFSFALLWLSVNMLIRTLPARENGRRFDDRDRGWGWSILDRSLNFKWGLKSIYWNLPFITTECEASQILSLSRNRVVFHERSGRFLEEYKAREESINANSASFPYIYELNNGERQEVTAKVHVTRHIRRRKWTPFRKNYDSIWVEFSDEVGPERGSWKGGCTGCGWTMRKGETVRACLRRMESERRFER